MSRFATLAAKIPVSTGWKITMEYGSFCFEVGEAHRCRRGCQKPPTVKCRASVVQGTGARTQLVSRSLDRAGTVCSGLRYSGGEQDVIFQAYLSRLPGRGGIRFHTPVLLFFLYLVCMPQSHLKVGLTCRVVRLNAASPANESYVRVSCDFVAGICG